MLMTMQVMEKVLPKAADGTELPRAKAIDRIITAFAGPFFNFVLAFVLSLFVIGFVGYDPATVLSVTPGSPAAEAGLQSGDIIKKMGGSGIFI